MREVDSNRQLAAVTAQVIRGFARVVPGRVLQVRRSPRAGVVTAAGPLDLDDRRAEISKELRAPRSREDAGEVEDREVGERAGHRDGQPRAAAPPIILAERLQLFSATMTSSSIFFASPKSIRLLSL